MRGLWGSKIGLVSQNPQGALNPTLTIGRQLDEMGARHLGLARSRRARRRRWPCSTASTCPIPGPSSSATPISSPVACCSGAPSPWRCSPIPISSSSTSPPRRSTSPPRRSSSTCWRNCSDEFDLAILYITHNLGVVSRFCDRVVVMYAGEVFEEGAVADLFSRPLHPYTANLLHCVPRIGPRVAGTEAGWRPCPEACLRSTTCRAAASSPRAARWRWRACTVARPPLVEAATGRLTACLRWPVLLNDEGQRAAIHTEERRAGPLPGARRRRPEAPRKRGARGPRRRRRRPGTRHATPARAAASDRHGRRQGLPRPSPAHQVRAVDGVSLSFDRRQTFGLVGESGSGKTTLARMVAGLTPADRRHGLPGGQGAAAHRGQARPGRPCAVCRWSSRAPRARSIPGTRSARNSSAPSCGWPASTARRRRSAPSSCWRPSGSRRLPRPLPGGAERRREAAGGHRPGLRRRARPGHLRRTRVVAGRLGAGRAHEPAPRPSGRGRYLVPVHLPRPRGRAAPVPLHRGDVSGQAGGAGGGGAGALPALPPLHRGAAVGRARPRPDGACRPGAPARTARRRRATDDLRAAPSIPAARGIWATSAAPRSHRGGPRRAAGAALAPAAGPAGAGPAAGLRPTARPPLTPSAATSPTRSSGRSQRGGEASGRSRGAEARRDVRAAGREGGP